MDLSRFSLMTFQMATDLQKKTMTVLETLELAQNAGLGFVDVMRVNKKQIPEYQSAMNQTGVRVFAYIDVISFLNPKSQWLNQLRTGLDTAKQLGAAYFMIVPYGVFDVYRARRFGKEKVMNCMIDGFREAVSMGRAAGIRICVETTPHKESCLSGSDDCLRILDAVESLDFVFDTANMLPSGEDPLEAYQLMKDRIAYVHLKDVAVQRGGFVPAFAEHTPDGGYMECTLWGCGEIPIKKLFDSLLEDGYQGYFAIEYTHPGKDACGIQKHAAHLKSFFRYLNS